MRYHKRMLSSQQISDIFLFAYFGLSISQIADRPCHIPKQIEKKKEQKQIYISICEDFFRWREQLKMKNSNISTREATLFSAALWREAALSLAAGASAGPHAGLGRHTASRWGSPSVSIAHHPASSSDATRTPRTPIVAPHVSSVVAAAPGLPLTHCPRLLLLDVQTHLTSKHDGLRGEQQC